MKVGEELFFGGGRRFRVVDVVEFDAEDEPPFVGLLQVEAAWLGAIVSRIEGLGGIRFVLRSALRRTCAHMGHQV